MKIVFMTNFMNHHQEEFCNAMYAHLGNDFCTALTGKIDDERKSLGYRDMDKKYKYLIRTYESIENVSKVKKLCVNADIVIIGSAPFEYIKERLKQNKITFIYSERIYKQHTIRHFSPRFMWWLYANHIRPKNCRLYYLCASAYTADDINKFIHRENKFFKWGYFPPLKEYQNLSLMMQKKKDASIVWVARMIDWKHPEVPILIAERLKKNGYKFELNLIGNGCMLESIRDMTDSHGLSDCVHVLGSMYPEEVRTYMEQSKIFLFTSDRNEGWGAVLNEAMNSGCAAVASHEIGATPFLINDGENGLIYEDGNIDDLFNKVKFLLDNSDECNRIAENAYKTIYNEWNGKAAADRLLKLCEALINEKSGLFESGPCSRAEILKDNWYRRKG